MSGQERTRADNTVHLANGNVHTDWCPTCKAYTVLTGTTLLLTSGGVSTVGTWQWCEVCNDPESSPPPRRIDRG